MAKYQKAEANYDISDMSFDLFPMSELFLSVALKNVPKSA